MSLKDQIKSKVSKAENEAKVFFLSKTYTLKVWQIVVIAFVSFVVGLIL